MINTSQEVFNPFSALSKSSPVPAIHLLPVKSPFPQIYPGQIIIYALQIACLPRQKYCFYIDDSISKYDVLLALIL